MLLIGLTWGALAFAVSLLVARIIRLGDQRQAEGALFSFLEADLLSPAPEAVLPSRAPAADGDEH